MIPDTKMTISALTADQRKKTVVLYRVNNEFQARGTDALIIVSFDGVRTGMKDDLLTATFAVEHLDELEGTTGNICNRIMAKGFSVAVVGDNDDDIINYYPACKLEVGYTLSYDSADVIYTHDVKLGRELVHFPFSQYRRGVRVVEDGNDGTAELTRNRYAFIVLGKNGGKAYYRYLMRDYSMTQPEAIGFAHGLEAAEHQNHRNLLVQTYVMVSRPGLDCNYILSSQSGFGMFADVPIPEKLPEAFKINPHDNQELDCPLFDDDTDYRAMAWHLQASACPYYNPLL